MSELTFLILRFGFLALLWIFIIAIVYAMRSDLFGAPVRKIKAGGETGVAVGVVETPAFIAPSGGAEISDSALPGAGSAASARKLMITSGAANGTEIILDEDILTIGRSPDSTLSIVDEYTSTHHAKLERQADGWVLTDLDSTNGTRVNGQKVVGSMPLAIFVPVTIGKTTFELRP
ncbi:FHA domain-containing protein [Canibacter sp. lx-45]|uniref:FHA domain-containing protein FhaB/FipA n=1 Tax=Canibacter zhuwentaonis TaxID=2837491 RepID=UPI001BDC093A|nr:FHA domain-containing protein [Canibacter zhuwentaonis]MBT1035829.1 FHA domain-containing protein [Canibacter zhuwentaonis]